MKLFDLHCDTLCAAYDRGESFSHNSCQVSLDKAFSVFDEYRQVTAVWSRDDLDGEECYRRFDRVVNKVFPTASHENFTPILSVEGGKLLCGDISRLDHLYRRGVRVFTPVWAGHCCIGGAWDTDEGLTGFGYSVIERCCDLGIIPDVSHASDRMFYEIAEIAGKRGGTVIASHSCSRAVFDHRRNLTDDMARTVSELGGVIGVNLVVPHLGSPDISAVINHISHLAGIAGEDSICLGCDLDGTDALPDGIKDISDLPVIHGLLSDNKYPRGFADKVFYSNARNFFEKHDL